MRPAANLKGSGCPGGGEPGHADIVHDSGRRTFAKPTCEALQPITPALRHALHRSIRHVGDPPGQTQGERLAEHEVAKADPMDPPGHGDFQPNDRSLL